MTKEIIIRLVAAALALLGALILWRSTVWGLQAFPAILRDLGSLSGDGAFAVAYAGPVAALRTLGGILLGVGLWRALEYPRREK